MAGFFEFFAGGGMARMGLGPNWNCLFANDFDRKKAQSYKDNWGADVLKFADVRHISVSDLPSQADLVWGSFPCQDLSLAGGGAGLKGDRSGTFWPFWDVIKVGIFRRSYFYNFLKISTWSETFNGTSWQNDWTVFYWGWWIGWSK